MTSSSTSRSNTAMVTQMYTFNSWSKAKNLGGGLPYVGFPGLSLTPIQESPLLMDSILNDEMDHSERQRCLQEIAEHESWDPHDMKSGSLPNHWVSNGVAKEPPLYPSDNKDKDASSERVEAAKLPASSQKPASSPTSKMPPPKACTVNVHVVRATTFMPKEEPMTINQKRAHICKLLLFALCGFVIVAGIVLWIFSPAFT